MLCAVTTWFATTPRFADPAGALRLAHFADLLARFPAGHLLDLGAGHGAFSRVAADLGWRVTAVDARSERFPADARVTWVVRDVREYDDLDDVDVVACLGLFYHLTLPDQLALLRRLAPRPVLLDTHVAMPHRADHAAHGGRVGEPVDVDGYSGRYYRETGRHTRPTAAWGNDVSFWPTTASLERQVYAAGYDVLEQVRPSVAPDRSFFVARRLSPAVRDRLDDLVERGVVRSRPQAPALPAARLAPEATRESPFAGAVDLAARSAAGVAVRRAAGKVMRRLP